MYDFQKASMWKRFSAALFDFILLSIIVTGTACLISFMLNYDAKFDKYNELHKDYHVQYGLTTEEEKDSYVFDREKLSEEDKAKYDEAEKAFYGNEEAMMISSTLLNCSFIIISFSVLAGYLLVEFMFPLIFKNGQTLGKKIFGVGVMRRDGVKISPVFLFVRTILGKYTLEAMLPIFALLMLFFGVGSIIGLFVLIVIVVAQIILLIVTKARTPLHDILAQTVTVDFATQMIFGTLEEKHEYELMLKNMQENADAVAEAKNVEEQKRD